MPSAWNFCRCLASFIFAGSVLPASATMSLAEHIKIGLVRTTASPIYIAAERKYFEAEGLEPELVFFDSAPPIAVAVASGSIDFAASGISGALFNLASGVRIIAGGPREAPTFQLAAYLTGKAAFAAGLKSVHDFPGHSVAITQFGAPVHYDLVLLIRKYGFNPESIRVVPTPSNPSQIAALIGGSVDAAIVPISYASAAVDAGDIKILGYVGDETPWQNSAAFTSTKIADDRSNVVKAFLRAFQRATRDYHDAFTGPGEKRANGPTAENILSILSKSLNLTREQVNSGIQYIDRDARLDVDDIVRQIEWYKSQGMISNPVDPNRLIDKRYVQPLPTP